MLSGKLALALAFCSLACVLSAVDAKLSTPALKEVSDQGTTTLSTKGTSSAVLVELVTRKASTAEDKPGLVTRCSGGRVPCSVVDKLIIHVDGKDLDVPRRAALQLADVNRGEVLTLNGRRFELLLDCGDAAAGYEARLFFDKRRVLRLEIWAGEAGRLEQTTTYKDLSRAFE